MQRKATWFRAISALTVLTMSCFGFTGLSAADSITTGPNSTNTTANTENITCTVTNNNDINVSNNNDQSLLAGLDNT
jgi:hypothetical protein